MQLGDARLIAPARLMAEALAASSQVKGGMKVLQCGHCNIGAISWAIKTAPTDCIHLQR